MKVYYVMDTIWHTSFPLSRIPAPSFPLASSDFIFETWAHLSPRSFVPEPYNKLQINSLQNGRHVNGISVRSTGSGILLDPQPQIITLCLHNGLSPWWETNSWIQLPASLQNFKQLIWKFHISILFIEHAGIPTLELPDQIQNTQLNLNFR